MSIALLLIHNAKSLLPTTSRSRVLVQGAAMRLQARLALQLPPVANVVINIITVIKVYTSE